MAELGLALPALYDQVVAVFTADAEAVEATPPVFAFGWREPAKQTTTPAAPGRIVFVPGDDQSGALGTEAPAQLTGRNPRPLVSLREAFTVYVWARDGAAPRDERAQYAAARKLYDAFRRALYLAAYAIGAGPAVAVQSAAWMVERRESPNGAELRVLCTVDTFVPDEPWADATGVSPELTTEIHPEGVSLSTP